MRPIGVIDSRELVNYLKLGCSDYRRLCQRARTTDFIVFAERFRNECHPTRSGGRCHGLGQSGCNMISRLQWSKIARDAI
jgi:hypothetical protein